MAHTETVALRRSHAALAAATILSLPLGAIYAFSVFITPLEAVLGASRSDLASVFGISVIAFTVGMNVAPKLFGLMPVSLLIAASVVLSAVGVAIAAVAPSFLWLAFGYGVLFALGGGLAYVAAQQSVNASPLARPGLVNGYLVSLFPLGAMIAAPACGWGIARFGVRETLGGLAVTVALCGAVATVLIAQSGVRLSRPSAARQAVQSSAEIARLRSIFIRLFLVFTFAASAGLMVLSQVVVMIEAYGAGKALALAAATGITAAIAAARLMGGLLVDRLPVPVVAASAQAMALAGALLVVLVPGPETAIASLAMIGAGYGLISGVAAAAVAMFWPKALFGQVAGRVYIAWCLAALTLPVVAAKIFELTGGYHWAIVLAGAANLCGVVVGAMLPRQQSPLPPDLIPASTEKSS